MHEVDPDDDERILAMSDKTLFIYSLCITILFFTLFLVFMFGAQAIHVEKNMLDAFFSFTIFLTFFLGLKDLYLGFEKGKAHLFTGSLLSLVLGIIMALMYVSKILVSLIEKSGIQYIPDTDMVLVVVSSILSLPCFLSFKGRKIHH